jgi:flagellar hook assembly protein FlgD
LFEESRINISIYNSLGQKVISYDRVNVNTGEHSVVWDGTDRYGNRVSSGVYFYRLETSFGDKKKKMLLLK